VGAMAHAWFAGRKFNRNLRFGASVARRSDPAMIFRTFCCPRINPCKELDFQPSLRATGP